MPDADADRERLITMAMIDSQIDPFDLDSLAVSDRFRLFGFTRRDDYLAYLWVLRAMDRLRGAHVAQAHTDDVAEVLAELAGWLIARRFYSASLMIMRQMMNCVLPPIIECAGMPADMASPY